MIQNQGNPQPQQGNKIKKPGGEKPRKKRKKRFGFFINLLLLIALIGVGYLFYYTEQQRAAVEEELQNTTSRLEELQQSAENSGQQVANEVLTKLRNHIDIPLDPQPTVATITDVERLRETNDFYANADNNDHLIITETRAILYDPDRDIIIDIVPVRINQTASPAPDGEESPGVSPSPGEEGAAEDGEDELGGSPSPSPTPTF